MPSSLRGERGRILTLVCPPPAGRGSGPGCPCSWEPRSLQSHPRALGPFRRPLRDRWRIPNAKWAPCQRPGTFQLCFLKEHTFGRYRAQIMSVVTVRVERLCPASCWAPLRDINSRAVGPRGPGSQEEEQLRQASRHAPDMCSRHGTDGPPARLPSPCRVRNGLQLTVRLTRGSQIEGGVVEVAPHSGSAYAFTGSGACAGRMRQCSFNSWGIGFYMPGLDREF